MEFAPAKPLLRGKAALLLGTTSFAPALSPTIPARLRRASSPRKTPLCSRFWGARGSSQSSRTGRAGIELRTLYTSRLKSSERVGGPAGATVCPRVSPSAAASQAAFAFLAPWLLINEESFLPSSRLEFRGIITTGIIREGLEQLGPELSPTWKSRHRGMYPASLQRGGWWCKTQGLNLDLSVFFSQAEAQTLLATREKGKRSRFLLQDKASAC